jgi:hypothetical protein
MSFQSDPGAPLVLTGTKWISPVNDNCFDSLCFTSEMTVMYYSCKHNWYAEVGYKIKGDTIEIQAYGKSTMEPINKMILRQDDGVLKQLKSQENSFATNFIIVPNGVCD